MWIATHMFFHWRVATWSSFSKFRLYFGVDKLYHKHWIIIIIVWANFMVKMCLKNIRVCSPICLCLIFLNKHQRRLILINCARQLNVCIIIVIPPRFSVVGSKIPARGRISVQDTWHCQCADQRKVESDRKNPLSDSLRSPSVCWVRCTHKLFPLDQPSKRTSTGWLAGGR